MAEHGCSRSRDGGFNSSPLTKPRKRHVFLDRLPQEQRERILRDATLFREAGYREYDIAFALNVCLTQLVKYIGRRKKPKLEVDP